MNTKRTAAILFGGIGGFSAGIQRSMVEAYGKVERFRILCSIDYDPIACRNHDIITGEQTSVHMDLFTRQQYIKWHGHEPPPEWREVTPWDIWVAFDCQVPDYIFLSPPCKGFSGLLPGERAESEQYQALNLLTLHGLELVMQACLMYGDKLPAFVHFENVPRIRTRGKSILAKIKAMLKKYGFAYDERADHNLGEIGGLGQNRVRFLILARNEKRVPNFCYLPPKKPLKTIGDVIGPLPAPGDTDEGGPLNRLPNLQWKTWVRLALIPAGGDWRDLNKIEWQQYRIMHEPRGGAYAVEDWEATARTVTGTAGPGRSNGVAAVADPCFGPETKPKYNHTYRITTWGETAGTVTGASRPNNGAICISDPQLNERHGRHPGVYHIVKADETAPCVTGTRFGSGALAIADPCCKTNLHPDSYGVQGWDEAAKTVRGASRIMQSASSIADPCISSRPGRYTDKYRMQHVDKPAATVTGVTDVQSGAQLIADPSMNCSPRSGTLGVQSWNEPGKTVIGNADIHASTAAVADPRVPSDKESGVWVIIAEDGTWHRPLTTFELAMLQSFSQYLPDGRPFQLEGCSDAKAREYIGNAVPPDAAEAMGNVILMALASADAEIGFELSFSEVWVTPQEERQPAIIH